MVVPYVYSTSATYCALMPCALCLRLLPLTQIGDIDSVLG